MKSLNSPAEIYWHGEGGVARDVPPVDPLRICSRLPYHRPRAEPLRYRSELMLRGDDFDPTGFELLPAPEAPAEATGPGELFADDYCQPDAADSEPVFWSGGAAQVDPADDYVQADAPEFMLKNTRRLTASGRSLGSSHRDSRE